MSFLNPGPRMTDPSQPVRRPYRDRISAAERLERLPEVFSVEEFQREQELSAKAASVYLARWQAQGLIFRMGPRSGLWANLSKIGEVTARHKLAAVLLKHPQALVGGPSALAQHGLLASPAEPTLIVPHGGSRAQIDGVRLSARPPRVHAFLKEASTPGEGIWEGFWVLPEALAWDDWQARCPEESLGVGPEARERLRAALPPEWKRLRKR